MTRTMRQFGPAVAALGLMAGWASAGPVTYTMTGTGTGSLGSTPFTDAAFILTATSDTSLVTETGEGIFRVPNFTLTVAVAGLSGTFTSDTGTVVNQNPEVQAAGFSDLSQDRAILFDNSPVFSSYDLTSSLGPVSGVPIFNISQAFPTTAGAFILVIVPSLVTFEATVIPEPATIVMAGTAVPLALVVARRRRKRAAVNAPR